MVKAILNLPEIRSRRMWPTRLPSPCATAIHASSLP
jgi:hypothetical protein